MHQQNKDNRDPMRMPTINGKLDTPGVVLRRPAKPKLHGVKENCKWVYKEILGKNWVEAQEEQRIQ